MNGTQSYGYRSKKDLLQAFIINIQTWYQTRIRKIFIRNIKLNYF